VAAIARAAGTALLDTHTDADHNRSVLTISGPDVEAAVRAVVVEAVRLIDLRSHGGVHPRLGAADVVPFVALDDGGQAGALAARDRFAAWAAGELGIPVFLYGPERSLPEVRRNAFEGLAPDLGPPTPHPSAGAICAGARPVLVAYNLWLADGVGIGAARAVAADLRKRRASLVRTLALRAGNTVQVSMNLIDPLNYGPAQAYDEVASHVEVRRAELVGLAPAAVLEAVDATRWDELDLEPSRTIEARSEVAARSW